MKNGLCGLAAGAALVAALVPAPLAGQESEITLILFGNLTADGTISPFTSSTSLLAPSLSYTVSNAFGGGVELQYRFPGSNIAVSASVEVSMATEEQSIAVSSGAYLPVEDGWRVMPVELTGYFILPASGRVFRLYMGGGGGAYFGRRVYRLAGVEAPTVQSTPGFGIHALVGGGYRLTEKFAIYGEMKFRDVQFESTNQFATDRVQSGGTTIIVGRRPFESSIHIDGMVFQIGVALTL